MRARHSDKIDWSSIGAQSSLAVALIVAEAVLDSDNDPESDGLVSRLDLL